MLTSPMAKTNPKGKANNMNVLEEAKKVIDQFNKLFFPPTKQAISMPDIYNNIGYALNPDPMDESQPYKRLIDCYIDGSEIYAVIGMEGKLYKSLVNVSGGNITLGDLAQVEIDYKPVQQSFRVLQQADGKLRWFAFPAATAVLNKNGYLNSRELYDNFVKHIEQDGAPMPYLSFYHVDEYGDGQRLELGMADFVAREGYTLLISGLFNDTPLAQQLAKSTKWDGTSIGYEVDPKAIQEIKAGDGYSIPVHTDGLLREVSALQEIDAGCLMTAFYSKGVKQMNQSTLKKLKELAGDNPEAIAQVEALAEHVDQVNQTIVGENLVRQAQEASDETTPPSDPPAQENPPATPPVAENAPAEPAPADPPVFTLSEEALQAVADQVREGFVADLAIVTQSVQTLANDVSKNLETLNATLTGLQSRLEKVEKTDQEKVGQALVDMPRNHTIVLGVQPRLRNQVPVAPVVPAGEQTSDDMVASTLEMLHQKQAPKK